jgi:hypothetical protein
MIINQTNKVPISKLLLSVLENKQDEEFMKIEDLVSSLQDRGFAILMFLFSFPMAIPLPYPPGFTTVLGMPLIFLSVQMLLGKSCPWMPKWLGNKQIKAAHIRVTINTSSKIFAKFEKFMKPRLEFFSSNAGEKAIGFISLLCAISISLPIFFGNAIPSAGIMLMSIGFLYRDGIVTLFGIIVGIFGVFVAALVVHLGIAAFEFMLKKIYLMIF